MFDAFGKPRTTEGNSLFPARLQSVSLSRNGFTEHRHLDEVELIHMNGRGYDYNLGRFLSVDPIIQSPGNSQSLNPYSYIMNNPLAGTDPSGYASVTGSRIDREIKKSDIIGDNITGVGGNVTFSGSFQGGGNGGSSCNGEAPQGRVAKQSSQAVDINNQSNQAFENALANGAASDYFNQSYGLGGGSGADSLGLAGQFVGWHDSINGGDISYAASLAGGVLESSKGLNLAHGKGAFLALQAMGHTMGDYKFSFAPNASSISLDLSSAGRVLSQVAGYGGFGISALAAYVSYEKSLITSNELVGKIAVDLTMLRVGSSSLPGFVMAASYGAVDIYYPAPKGVPGAISLKRDVINAPQGLSEQSNKFKVEMMNFIVTRREYD
ncbi:RHS repeat domain-containing protein [Rheinheimera tangshanensis]|nr:RHS repeat-associated core domain-containing protein [Rheinheimera tangshanensis]GGM44247.1 hypothetical protein GCM10010920_00590 [Rheinheimera tangshanensis]